MEYSEQVQQGQAKQAPLLVYIVPINCFCAGDSPGPASSNILARFDGGS